MPTAERICGVAAFADPAVALPRQAPQMATL